MKKNKTTSLVPANQAQYGYLRAIYLSFYSRNVYADVGKRWKGFGFIYLFIVILLFSLPMGLRNAYYYDKFFTHQIIEPIKEIPTIYVQEGKVTFDKPMPYFGKNKEGQIVSIVDTTGTIKGFSSIFPHLTILITKDSIMYRIPELHFTPDLLQTKKTDAKKTININKVDLASYRSQVFNGKDWIASAHIGSIRILMVFIMPLFTIGFLYGMFLFLIFVLAFLGQLVSQVFFDMKIKFKTSTRLMMVASTPMLFAFLFTLTFELARPYLGYVFILILAFYYCYALMSFKRESQKLAVE